ncbi:TPA: hypothetical protein QDB43_000324 [Burkholderia vietnamiensis]|nr:hypothetical protein [Burkholderia vietnamiensis]
MPRLTTPDPSVVHPKMPNATVQQLDAVADTFGIIRSRVTRVIIGASLADASLCAPILAEIERQRSTRLTGESAQVIATMDYMTANAFSDLMASTGARATEVARAILIVACDGRLARFKHAFIEESASRDEVLERQRAKVLATAKRLGLELKVDA